MAIVWPVLTNFGFFLLRILAPVIATAPVWGRTLGMDPSEHDHEVNHPLPINKLIAATKSQNALFIVIG